MYKCNECNGVFEEPKKVSAESFFGVNSEFEYNYGNIVYICPYCEENNIIEITEEELNEEELNEEEVIY